MPELCGCQEPGTFNCGVTGVLANVINGRIASKVERCDACHRYASDEDAKHALVLALSGRRNKRLQRHCRQCGAIEKRTDLGGVIFSDVLPYAGICAACVNVAIKGAQG